MSTAREFREAREAQAKIRAFKSMTAAIACRGIRLAQLIRDHPDEAADIAREAKCLLETAEYPEAKRYPNGGRYETRADSVVEIWKKGGAMAYIEQFEPDIQE